MLKAISRFFEANFSEPEQESVSSTAHRLQLASAALMIELCKSDQSIDDTETSALVEILETRFELEPSQLSELMELAEQEARDSTSLYQFTSLMNENFEYSEKVTMVGNMWEVAFADGKIDRYEEHLIRKVADLLYLSHLDFIKSKIIARDKYEN